MEQLANNAITTLNTTINSSTTSVVIVDATLFPSTGDYRILIESELMKVSSRSGTTLTVVRGQEGTTAAGHTAGVPVSVVLSKTGLENLLAEQYQVGVYASRPASARIGAIYQATDAQLGWRYNGASWDLINPIFVPNANKLDFSTGWTAVNHSTQFVYTDINGVAKFRCQSAGGENIRGYSKNLPSAPYTLTIAGRNNGHTYQYTSQHLSLYDSTKVKVLQWLGTSGAFVSVDEYTNGTTFNGTQYRANWDPGQVYWLRIQDNNTNWISSISMDGLTWDPIDTRVRNGFLTATKVLIGSNHVNGATDRYFTSEILGYWEA